MIIFVRTIVVILPFVVLGHCTSEKTNEGNKCFDELNDKLSLANFNFFKLGMKRSKIIDKVGNPTGWGGGSNSIYYSLRNGERMHLVFAEGGELLHFC